MIRIWLQYIIPQRFLSRLLGWLSDVHLPILTRWVIAKFIRNYQVNMTEAGIAAPTDYQTFNDFFTRRLLPGLRPIAEGVVSPADGCVSQVGLINGGEIFQAKGFSFDVENFLGGERDRAAPFFGGEFLTIYLAPKDYHRVHMPCAGQLKEMVYIPGQLFSVNHDTASRVPNLFGRNERVACLFDTEHGPMAMVLVGAMIVGSVVIKDEVIAPRRPREISIRVYEKPIAFEKGQELGYFKLGSTVVVLFGRDAVTWKDGLVSGSVVRVGERVGDVK